MWIHKQRKNKNYRLKKKKKSRMLIETKQTNLVEYTNNTKIHTQKKKGEGEKKNTRHPSINNKREPFLYQPEKNTQKKVGERESV